jgi:hypothetical protein
LAFLILGHFLEMTEICHTSLLLTMPFNWELSLSVTWQ